MVSLLLHLVELQAFGTNTGGSSTSTVSTNTNSTSTNFSAIGIKFVPVELLCSKIRTNGNWQSMTCDVRSQVESCDVR